MVVITFPDKETELRGLGFLRGHFSGKVIREGEEMLHLVPEAALEALTQKNIPFTIKETPTYEHYVAHFRATASPLI